MGMDMDTMIIMAMDMEINIVIPKMTKEKMIMMTDMDMDMETMMISGAKVASVILARRRKESSSFLVNPENEIKYILIVNTDFFGFI